MMEKEPSFSCVSSDMPVDEEEEVRSDSSCSFFGVWGDFLQHSFQSLTHTEQMEGSMVRRFMLYLFLVEKMCSLMQNGKG